MKKPVVLIVDDEKDARLALVNFLNVKFDCEFREAGDGVEAVKFVKENPCDLILLDIKMPKKSGMSVVKEAKSANPNLDILVISAWVSGDVAEEAIKLGATDYAVKPFDFKAIALKFANILDKRGQKISKT